MGHDVVLLLLRAPWSYVVVDMYQRAMQLLVGKNNCRWEQGQSILADEGAVVQ